MSMYMSMYDTRMSTHSCTQVYFINLESAMSWHLPCNLEDLAAQDATQVSCRPPQPIVPLKLLLKTLLGPLL